MICRLEGKNPDASVLEEYATPDTERYNRMVDEISKELHFTTLRYQRVEDMIEATGLPAESLCTYCWNGKG